MASTSAKRGPSSFTARARPSAASVQALRTASETVVWNDPKGNVGDEEGAPHSRCSRSAVVDHLVHRPVSVSGRPERRHRVGARPRELLCYERWTRKEPDPDRLLDLRPGRDSSRKTSDSRPPGDRGDRAGAGPMRKPPAAGWL